MLRFTDLSELDRAQRDRMRSIYQQAFPVGERERFDAVVTDARRGKRITLVVLDDGEPIGFAVLSRLRSVPCTFLEYYAVAEQRRGQGVGRLLWVELQRTLARLGEPAELVFEVEDPDEPGIDPDEVLTRRWRLRFYEALGAVVLPLRDFVVPHTGGTGHQRMLLMWAGGAGEPPTDGRQYDLRRALYTEGIGLPEDHPLLDV